MKESQRQRDWCDSGAVAITGRPDGDVVVPAGHAASWAAAAGAALSALPCFGDGVDGSALLAERAAFTGWSRQGQVSVGKHARLLPTADGWAVLSCARPDDPALLGAMIGSAVSGSPWDPVSRWLRSRSRAEIVDRMELLGIAGGCVDPQPSEPLPIPSKFRSLAGALVVDFSALWAGPLCANLLGVGGARVIKVETPARPDGARRGNVEFYDLLNAGHESVVLDPDSATQRKWLRRLVDAADIVIEASRPRALQRFGLDADRHAARGGTWLSITAYGRSSNRIGFGDDVAGACGLVAVDGDGTPLFAGDAIADPLTGLRAAVSAFDEINTKMGKVWDLSMAETVSSTLSGSVVVPAGTQATSIAAPRHRTVAGSAPESGANTADVLRDLGVHA